MGKFHQKIYNITFSFSPNTVTGILFLNVLLISISGVWIFFFQQPGNSIIGLGIIFFPLTLILYCLAIGIFLCSGMIKIIFSDRPLVSKKKAKRNIFFASFLYQVTISCYVIVVFTLTIKKVPLDTYVPSLIWIYSVVFMAPYSLSELYKRYSPVYDKIQLPEGADLLAETPSGELGLANLILTSISYFIMTTLWIIGLGDQYMLIIILLLIIAYGLSRLYVMWSIKPQQEEL